MTPAPIVLYLSPLQCMIRFLPAFYIRGHVTHRPNVLVEISSVSTLSYSQLFPFSFDDYISMLLTSILTLYNNYTLGCILALYGRTMHIATFKLYLQGRYAHVLCEKRGIPVINTHITLITFTSIAQTAL